MGRFVELVFGPLLAGPLFAPATLAAELQNAADGFDRLIDSLRNFAIGRFQCPGAGGRLVKLAGKPGAVAAEDVNLFGELAIGAIGLEPPFGCGLERFERQGQASGRGFDRVGVAHMAFRRGQSRRRRSYEKRATATIYGKKLTSCRGKTSTPRHWPCA